jgi:hypothetical protein
MFKPLKKQNKDRFVDSQSVHMVNYICNGTMRTLKNLILAHTIVDSSSSLNGISFI